MDPSPTEATTPAAPSAKTATTLWLSFREKLPVVLGGTASLLFLATVLMQLAAGENKTARAEEAGRASVAAPASKPLARVGTVTIAYDEVARECMERHGAEILEQIINRKMIENACRQVGVSVTREEVEAEIDAKAKEFSLDRENWLHMLQTERGLTPLQYKRDVIWPMLALRKLAGTEVDITDADVDRAFIRDFGPRVKAKMIMCDNIRRAQGVWQQARETPDDFGRLARDHSVDPTTKSLDGAIPPIPRYSGQDELENAAFALREGEVSGIVELPTPAGKRYVILKCEGRTEPRVTDIAAVRPQLVEMIRREKVQQSVAEVFQRIKAETPIDNYLTGEKTSGVRQTSASAFAR
ncbi:MAG: peptidylprolyl isomerase [Planctomycetota bacterium]